MDETKELLKVILSRLQEMSAEVQGLTSLVTSLDSKVTSLDSKVSSLDNKVTTLDSKVTGLESQITEFRKETGAQLAVIEGRFAHLTEKWMEHDEEIYKLKRRQA